MAKFSKFRGPPKTKEEKPTNRHVHYLGYVRINFPWIIFLLTIFPLIRTFAFTFNNNCMYCIGSLGFGKAKITAEKFLIGIENF